jgi:xanthine permease XanP
VLLYGLEDNPPPIAKLLAALQHLLAIFVSIITAPLLICIGMGLDARETSYMISSALVISGVATFIQVRRFGRVGSGLLSIQGTSFTFIGPLIFAAHTMRDQYTTEQLLGVIFGCTMVGAVMMMVLSQFLDRLQRVVTPTVTGTAVMMLGLSLIMVTVNNLVFEYNQALETGRSAWLVPAYAVGVIALISWLALRPSPWLRLASISIGLGVGYLVAWFSGQVDFSPMTELPLFFYPQPFMYELGFDLGIFLSLLPIYLVTAAESIGDLTATSNLSKQPLSGEPYWRRIKGGVLGDGFNSLLAAVFNTFPNTTFSQNNGVIQLTGVASRHVGMWLAVMLVIMGTFPIMGGLFQVMPKGLLYGATLLMFALVGLSGYQILDNSNVDRRGWMIVIVSLVTGLAATQLPILITTMSPMLAMLLGFPVATTTMCAVLLELFTPVVRPLKDITDAS